MGETDKYVETFRQEAFDLLADVEQIVLAMEEDPGNRDNINRLFRVMHTIKGSGAMFGFDQIASFAHHVETVLDMVRSDQMLVTEELVDLVLSSRDQINLMLNATNGMSAVDDTITESIVSRLSALSAQDDPSTVTEHTESSARIGSTASTDGSLVMYRIDFHPDPNVFATGMDPALLLEELRELGDCQIRCLVEEIPPVDDLDPERCYLGWMIELKTDKGYDAVNDVFIFVQDTGQLSISVVEPDDDCTCDEPHKLLGQILVEKGAATDKDIAEAVSSQKKLGELLVESGVTNRETVSAALAEQRAQDKARGAEKSDSVRVQSEKLDALVNLVGELVINQARLSEISGLSDNPDLAMTVEEVERLTGELRDTVLNIRMMPIGTTFCKFKRLVRDLSHELGKEIELTTSGGETEMDKTVLDRLSDPLVHLIRNSIDHGVEAPDERERVGKPRRGTIRLTAAHVGTNVAITVDDDGKGLNTEVIRKKAVERGLLSQDAEISDQEVYSLVFSPGLSTAENVTSVSGRGVGMDVVKREIDALRGTINISSAKGVGSRIELSLPLTLAIIDGLMVDVSSERFVVPLALIEECLELTEASLAIGRGRNVIQMRGEPIPFIRLRDVFGMSERQASAEEVVIVSVGEARVGLVVDRVIGNHQTVIKSLGRAYRDVEGVSGATILGDGNVALILDVPRLVRCAKAEEDSMLAAGHHAA